MLKPPPTTCRKPDATLRVLQLTDLHLFADPQGRLLGQNTRQTLELVLSAASRRLETTDLILLTGDLVHDESPQGYHYLQQRMEALGKPCLCLPGNHDQGRLMARILADHPIRVEAVHQLGAWNLVLLDSTVPGEDGGHLSDRQLSQLATALTERPKHPTLVCLHHQPVPVGSAWIDTIALDNAQCFFAIVDRHPQVRGILWGHIHQEFAATHNGVHLFGSPSTCIQFVPRNADFALDALTPGFRWLELHADGRIDSQVGRVANYPDPLDLSKKGY